MKMQPPVLQTDATKNTKDSINRLFFLNKSTIIKHIVIIKKVLSKVQKSLVKKHVKVTLLQFPSSVYITSQHEKKWETFGTVHVAFEYKLKKGHALFLNATNNNT